MTLGVFAFILVKFLSLKILNIVSATLYVLYDVFPSTTTNTEPIEKNRDQPTKTNEAQVRSSSAQHCGTHLHHGDCPSWRRLVLLYLSINQTPPTSSPRFDESASKQGRPSPNL
jgi:hypothetical protein